jgi:hypothetical protein
VHVRDRVAQQLAERRGHDLPRHAVAILQPAALSLLASLAEAAPVVVDLGLIGTGDVERDRLAEREQRAAVDRGELLAVELELDGHHGARRPGRVLAVVGDVRDARVREQRDVELGGLVALGVEPEVRGDAWHGWLLSFGSGALTGGARENHRVA